MTGPVGMIGKGPLALIGGGFGKPGLHGLAKGRPLVGREPAALAPSPRGRFERVARWLRLLQQGLGFEKGLQMPSRKVAQGALLTVVAIVVGAGTVANMVMPPSAQERVIERVVERVAERTVAAAPPVEGAAPIVTRPPSETAKRLVEGGVADAASGQAEAASLPAAAPAPGKPATARLTVNDTSGPANKAEMPVSQPAAVAPPAGPAFPPVQPLDTPAAAATAAPKPAPQVASQRPSAPATAGGATVDRPVAAKRAAADNRQRKPSVRPEPYAMRDFLRSHW